jgi:hypothetical protein
LEVDLKLPLTRLFVKPIQTSSQPNPNPMKTISDSADLKLKQIVVIGKFNDGKCRQVLISPKAEDVVLSAIMACEKQIRVLETIIEGIDIEQPSSY